MESATSCFNFAKQIHDRLELMMPSEARSFYQPEQQDALRLSWLDIVSYAYLKEQLVNISESAQVEYLKKACPKLV